MGRIASFLQPENAIDAVIPLPLFFGLGIYLVVLRYKSIRDRAVLFYWPPPPVRVFIASTILLSNAYTGSQPRIPGLHHREAQSGISLE